MACKNPFTLKGKSRKNDGSSTNFMNKFTICCDYIIKVHKPHHLQILLLNFNLFGPLTNPINKLGITLKVITPMQPCPLYIITNTKPKQFFMEVIELAS